MMLRLLEGHQLGSGDFGENLDLFRNLQTDGLVGDAVLQTLIGNHLQQFVRKLVVLLADAASGFLQASDLMRFVYVDAISEDSYTAKGDERSLENTIDLDEYGCLSALDGRILQGNQVRSCIVCLMTGSGGPDNARSVDTRRVHIESDGHASFGRRLEQGYASAGLRCLTPRVVRETDRLVDYLASLSAYHIYSLLQLLACT